MRQNGSESHGAGGAGGGGLVRSSMRASNSGRGGVALGGATGMMSAQGLVVGSSGRRLSQRGGDAPLSEVPRMELKAQSMPLYADPPMKEKGANGFHGRASKAARVQAAHDRLRQQQQQQQQQVAGDPRAYVTANGSFVPRGLSNNHGGATATTTLAQLVLPETADHHQHHGSASRPQTATSALPSAAQVIHEGTTAPPQRPPSPLSARAQQSWRNNNNNNSNSNNNNVPPPARGEAVLPSKSRHGTAAAPPIAGATPIVDEALLNRAANHNNHNHYNNHNNASEEGAATTPLLPAATTTTAGRSSAAAGDPSYYYSLSSNAKTLEAVEAKRVNDGGAAPGKRSSSSSRHNNNNSNSNNNNNDDPAEPWKDAQQQQQQQQQAPSDGVYFAQYRGHPETLVVYRSADERAANPERLNLDRRHLAVCPILKSEERVRLLNYQNNSIEEIRHLSHLPNLIFLDLYNNCIEALSRDLDMVPTLRVLMLGKNRIKEICHLEKLQKLDVLDLHSNAISKVERLEALTELRVLNLAGNRLTRLDDLGALHSLTELNVRRNQIECAASLDHLVSLQRVFLSNNRIEHLDHVACLFSVRFLMELSMDGNPVALRDHAAYRHAAIDRLKTLRHLDLKRITDAERRTVAAESQRLDDRKRLQAKTDLVQLERRKLEAERLDAIRAAEREWQDRQASWHQPLRRTIPTAPHETSLLSTSASSSSSQASLLRKGGGGGGGGGLTSPTLKSSSVPPPIVDGDDDDGDAPLLRTPGYLATMEPPPTGTDPSTWPRTPSANGESSSRYQRMGTSPLTERASRSASSALQQPQYQQQEPNTNNGAMASSASWDKRPGSSHSFARGGGGGGGGPSASFRNFNNSTSGTSTAAGLSENQLRSNSNYYYYAAQQQQQQQQQAAPAAGYYEVEVSGEDREDRSLQVYGEAWDCLDQPKIIASVTALMCRFVSVDRVVEKLRPHARQFTKLRAATLSDNAITSLRQVLHLGHIFHLGFPHLVDLTIESNPACSLHLLRPAVACACPQIRRFNSVEFTDAERARHLKQLGPLCNVAATSSSSSSSSSWCLLDADGTKGALRSLASTRGNISIKDDAYEPRSDATRRCVAAAMSKAIRADDARRGFEDVWPQAIQQLVDDCADGERVADDFFAKFAVWN